MKDENLTKAHVRIFKADYLFAKSANRSVIMNSQSSGAKLPESDREDMEVFLEKMQQVLPVLESRHSFRQRLKMQVKLKKKCSPAKLKMFLPMATSRQME